MKWKRFFTVCFSAAICLALLTAQIVVNIIPQDTFDAMLVFQSVTPSTILSK